MGFVAEAGGAGFGFVTAEGTRLRYFDSGTEGTAVVLLHGNGSMIEDFLCSGIVELAGPRFRLIAFDRPGFGHSERPGGRMWGPSDQASLLLGALTQLGVERPIVVGHSWGTLVALAMALDRPRKIAGLVLLSGYYYPVPRLQPLAVPLASDLVRYAIRRLMAPETLRRVFAPCRIPKRFAQDYPAWLSMRPSQMRAVDEDAAALQDATRQLSSRYGALDIPVHVIAGTEDRIVDTDLHSTRLHRDLSASIFQRVPGVGHMVHHAAPEMVVSAIAAVARRRGAISRPEWVNVQQRHWLHIDDDLVAA